jgi:hypothetical protein
MNEYFIFNLWMSILFPIYEWVFFLFYSENDTFLKRIKVELKNVMMKEDLDEATSKHVGLTL